MNKFSNKTLVNLEQQTLYSFQNEHDACGVGLVINLNGDKSHEIVETGLQVLENMVHRGAESADNGLTTRRGNRRRATP